MFSGSYYKTSGPPNKKGLGELIVEMAKPLYENFIWATTFFSQDISYCAR